MPLQVECGLIGTTTVLFTAKSPVFIRETHQHGSQDRSHTHTHLHKDDIVDAVVVPVLLVHEVLLVAGGGEHHLDAIVPQELADLDNVGHAGARETTCRVTHGSEIAVEFGGSAGAGAGRVFQRWGPLQALAIWLTQQPPQRLARIRAKYRPRFR